jgi:hypothetical protein
MRLFRSPFDLTQPAEQPTYDATGTGTGDGARDGDLRSPVEPRGPTALDADAGGDCVAAAVGDIE